MVSFLYMKENSEKNPRKVKQTPITLTYVEIVKDFYNFKI